MTEKRFNARKYTDDDFKERLKAELEDIVGLVKTDDVTDSVELKKEYYKNQSKDKHYTYLDYSKDGYIGSFYENGKPLTNKEVWDILKEQEETIKKQNQEITACYDTLTTIHELCNAVLNHDFEGIVSKVDFCNMLIEMDNKDLAFLKECFEAIRDNDLKTMTSLTLECKYGDVE